MKNVNNIKKMNKAQIADLCLRRFKFSDNVPPLDSEEYIQLTRKANEVTKKSLIALLEDDIRGFEVVPNEYRKYGNIKVKSPNRSTYGSAGYDFYSPVACSIAPLEKFILWTNIKAFMPNNELLEIYIRSSISIKYGLVLTNGTGIIDSSYYNNENNDGIIGIPLRNTTNKIIIIKKGERIAQGIFKEYLITSNDDISIDIKRKGGFGSTGV